MLRGALVAFSALGALAAAAALARRRRRARAALAAASRVPAGFALPPRADDDDGDADADGVVVDAAGGAADEQRAVLAMCASVRNASSEAWRDVRLTLCANELELLPCGPSDGAAAARRAPALRHWVGGDFFVRHLAGGFGDARDEDTADALLARAKARLATLFSVVIITDDLGSGEGDGARGDDPWQVLRAPLGWDRHATVLERTPTRANAAPRAASSRSKEMLANLAAINAPDLELFAFARELAANRTREFAADEARRRADPAAAERAVALKPPPPARPKVRQRWLAPH